MVVGFSGTRDGLTFAQEEALKEALLALEATELHHGDCVGADAECDDLARKLGVKVIIHPSMIASQRAWRSKTLPCKVLPEKPSLMRNREIVRSVDVLLAAPSLEYEVRRSGTWATIRYAIKQGVSVFIILPDGNIEEPVLRKESGANSSHEQPAVFQLSGKEAR
jgi:hypothetical protein